MERTNDGLERLIAACDLLKEAAEVAPVLLTSDDLTVRMEGISILRQAHEKLSTVWMDVKTGYTTEVPFTDEPFEPWASTH